MLIHIISGTYAHRPTLPNGKKSPYIVPVTRFDPPIDVDEAEAARLVEADVAEYIVAGTAGVTDDSLEQPDPSNYTPEEKTSQNVSEGQKNEEDDLTDDEDLLVYSADMKADELRAAMRERGLSLRIGMTKQEMADVLNGEAVEDGEEAPVFAPQDVVEP